MGGHIAAHQRVGLVADDDLAWRCNRLQPCRKVRLRSDDGVVHPVVAAEIADIAEPRIDAHADLERLLDSGMTPFRVQLSEAALHLTRHFHAGLCISDIALGYGIA